MCRECAEAGGQETAAGESGVAIQATRAETVEIAQHLWVARHDTQASRRRLGHRATNDW